MNSHEFMGVVAELSGDKPWPKPLHLLQAATMVDKGTEVGTAAKTTRTTSRILQRIIESPDRVQEALGIPLDKVDEAQTRRVRLILGQLALGRCAELAFEDIYRSEMHSEELELRDLRENRTDTDYRLHNGFGRPIYRINIKFHGARFRRASELVGLDPNDCFALATYKIHSALQKQEQEGLPYFFAIVGVPHLSGEIVGGLIPSRLVDAAAIFQRSPKTQHKRDFEDSVVDHLVSTTHQVISETIGKIKEAEWYMISARRADKLLRQLLFERVYALRIRGFAQQFRGAELDMHFSLCADLIPLKKFLQILGEGGQTKITTLMERGDL